MAVISSGVPYNIGSVPSDSYSSSYHYGGIGDGDPMDWDFFGRISNKMNGTEATNRFNAEQAALQREHELYMSNTAYQRAVADMKAAGINPATLSGVASQGSPASSSSSGAASGVSPKDRDIIGTLFKVLALVFLKKPTPPAK